MPTLRDKHPLKRKSVRPSSSTIRGMLPIKLFRSLDAAMQSLRTAGMRLEWAWKNDSVGWVCQGHYREMLVVELLPADEPFVGNLVLNPEQLKAAETSLTFPVRFKEVLKYPTKTTKKLVVFEFPLASTPERDLFSEFVEAFEPIFDAEIGS